MLIINSLYFIVFYVNVLVSQQLLFIRYFVLNLNLRNFTHINIYLAVLLDVDVGGVIIILLP